MDNIGIAIVSLSILVVVLTTILFNRKKSRKFKHSREDPWGSVGRGAKISDYIYIED
tara:strand:+ start:739 stop:909 length:171 start_codon:yes stop_codon:yes gene_type:complete